MQIAILTVFLTFASVKFDVPAGWKALPLSSSMRVADFNLAKVPGDSEDGLRCQRLLRGRLRGGQYRESDDDRRNLPHRSSYERLRRRGPAVRILPRSFELGTRTS